MEDHHQCDDNPRERACCCSALQQHGNVVHAEDNHDGKQRRFKEIGHI